MKKIEYGLEILSEINKDQLLLCYETSLCAVTISRP